MFQSYNLIAQLDVLENILVPVQYLDDIPPGIEDRARGLAERVGLGAVSITARPNSPVVSSSASRSRGP